MLNANHAINTNVESQLDKHSPTLVKRSLLVFLICLMCTHFAKSQSQYLELQNNSKIENFKPSAGKPKLRISTNTGPSKKPSFPGGRRALSRFLKEEMIYPKPARKLGIEGVVIVQFIVAKDGNLENISIVQSLGFGYDEEALRLVRKMPRWRPALWDGKPMAVQYRLPLHFKLN